MPGETPGLHSAGLQDVAAHVSCAGVGAMSKVSNMFYRRPDFNRTRDAKSYFDRIDEIPGLFRRRMAPSFVQALRPGKHAPLHFDQLHHSPNRIICILTPESWFSHLAHLYFDIVFLMVVD